MKRKVISLVLCLALMLSIMPVTALAVRDVSYEETLAQELKSLGLFKGVSDTEFELDRAPTRVEALIMLIRVLGVESDALGGAWTHPFTDVPGWADLYVGYAYENGLTNGVSATEFGSEDASAAMFLTFVLRALGYTDSGDAPDFVWSDPFTLAESIGILPETVDRVNFWRADVVLVSYAALGAYLKNTETTLAEKLIGAGVFTEAQYAALGGETTGEETIGGETTETVEPPAPALTADEIAEQLSDAVFRLDMYYFNGEFIGSATGVFISADGYAVTTFAIAANCYLYATTSDGSVSNAYVATVDCDYESDVVLLKVDDVTVPYLEIGDSDALVAGETLYTLDAAAIPDATVSVATHTVADPLVEAYETTYIAPSEDISGDGAVVLNGSGELVGLSAMFNTAVEGESVNYIVPSSRISELDLTATGDSLYFLPNYLPGMDTLDFGALTGVDLLDYVETPLGYTLQYDLTDFHDMHDGYASDHFDLSISYYMLALEMCGFETIETGVEDVYMMMTLDEAILITVSYTDGEEGIYIIAEALPTYYDSIPELPDFLWYYNGGKSGASTVNEDGTLSHAYTFERLSDEEAAIALDGYYALLEHLGFTEYVDPDAPDYVYYTKDNLFVGFTIINDALQVYATYIE